MELNKESKPQGPICRAPSLSATILPSGCFASCNSVRDIPVYPIEQHTFIQNIVDPFWQNFRATLNSGTLPNSCAKCINHEKEGLRSYRQQFNARFQMGPSPGQSFNPIYLDIRLGRKCNLACRMCTPDNSLPVRNEWLRSSVKRKREMAEAVSTEDWTNDQKRWEDLWTISSHVLDINFAGGEPLLYQAKVISFLQRFIDSGRAANVSLSFNTNLTLSFANWAPTLSQFKNVLFHVSADGFGPLNEYIRFGSNWQVFEKNLRELLKISQHCLGFRVEFCTTLQAYNLLHVDRLFDFYASLNLQYKIPYLNFLSNPLHFHAKVLPLELQMVAKKRLIASAEKFRECPKVERINQYAAGLGKFQIPLFPRFLEWANDSDKARGTNLMDHIPELAPYIETSVNCAPEK